jgi:dTMP kinase
LSGQAYHYADGIDPAYYTACAAGVRLPDLYLYLDVSPAIAAGRVNRPPDSRWETTEFTIGLPRAYSHCLQLLQEQHADTVVLDARHNALRVLSVALTAITDRLPYPTSTRSAA